MTYINTELTAKLRWVYRNGERILQQAKVHTEFHDSQQLIRESTEWIDVPLVEDVK